MVAVRARRRRNCDDEGSNWPELRRGRGRPGYDGAGEEGTGSENEEDGDGVGYSSSANTLGDEDDRPRPGVSGWLNDRM